VSTTTLQRSAPDTKIGWAFGGMFALLAAVAVGSSFWLRAGPFESGLAALQRGDEATLAVILEQATSRPIAAGRVAPLVELALATGETVQAVALLERFVAQQPNHIPALRRLVDVMAQVGFSTRLAEVLEQLHGLTGEVDHLRRSMEISDAMGLAAERDRLLERLVATGEAEAHEVRVFARRRSAAGDAASGYNSLLAALQKGAGSETVHVLSLAAVLALALPDQGSALTALGRAAAASPVSVSTAALELLERREARAALTLLSALPPATQDSPQLLPVLLRAEIEVDRRLASARLDRLRGSGRLPAEFAPTLALLTAEAGDTEAALALAASLPPGTVPPGLAGWLLERLAAASNLSLLARLPAGALAQDPLFAAAVAMERNAPREAEAALRRALERPPEAPAQRALLLVMLRRADLARIAFTGILDALRRGDVAPERLGLLPLLAETPQQSSMAVAALRPQRDRLPGAAAAWAILAAQQGQTREVLAWLPGANLPIGALLDIQSAALTRRDAALAEATAQAALRAIAAGQSPPAGFTEAEIALRGGLGGPMTEALVVRALDQIASSPGAVAERILWLLAAHPDLPNAARYNGRVSGHPALATLPPGPNSTWLLGIVAPDRATDLAARAAAEPLRFGPLLIAARYRQGGDAAGQAALRDMLGRLPAESREAAVHATLALALSPGAAPAIERGAAETLGGNWNFNVLARLERSGQRGPLLAALRARAADTSLPRTERLGAAARLGELNDREGATAAMRALAEGLGPEATELRQLMYLWGPAARPEALSWTERRAREAPPAQRGAWLAHLDYLGGNAAGLRLLDDWRDSLSTDPAVARAAAALFYRAGQVPGGEAMLAGAISAARDPATLAALGEAANAAALPRLALAAYGRALAQRPGERDWQLAAARAAASSHRPEEAARHYREVMASGRATPEVMLEAGDALRGIGEGVSARRIYGEALTRAGNDRLRARLLARLDRPQEARALLERLLQASRGDPELRAELMELQNR